LDNVKLNLSIKTCILELSKESIINQFKIVEDMGLPTLDLIQDICESFFLDYVNFIGIIKFLSFFLLEGVKGIYRLVYAIVNLINLSSDIKYTFKKESTGHEILETLTDKIAGVETIEKQPKKEIFKLYKSKTNKLDDMNNLLEIATQWKLTHLNNNYMNQFIPKSIKENLPKLNNFVYIPSFNPESRIIKRKEIPKLWELINSDIKFCNGILLFDKEKNPECNLNTIYEIGEKLDDNSKILFLIQTDKDEVFGGIMEQNIKLTENVKYLIPPSSYLFKIRPEIAVYEPKDKDHSEIVCFEPGSIRYGYGRDGPAITINYDLQEGSTEKNTVFGNDISLIQDYSNEGIFTIKGLEIYLMQ